MHLPKMSYVVKKTILIFLFVASAIGAQAQMAGVYTIDNTLPTGGTNYTSFTDAVSDLVALGINAAVTFNVTSGQIFNEQIDIPQITGSSATNTITVNGNTALLTFSPTSSVVPHTLRLSGADYMRFNNLRVMVSFNSNPGTALHLYNGSDHNIFDSVRCSAYLSNAPTVYIGPHATNQNLLPLYPSCDSNIFRNSQIQDGHIGVRITANAADSARGNEVINCWIDDFTNTGIDVSNGATACLISKNFFTNDAIRSNNQLYTGIRFTNTQKHTASKNRMTANGTSGIFQNYNLGLCRGVWTDNSSNINIINNIMWQFEGNYNIGIDLTNNSTNINVWHNSLSFFEYNTTKTGIRCQAAANNIQNNNIILGGVGVAYGLVLDSGNTVNYNNCFTPNATFFAFGRTNNINYTNLAAWQVASGYDANSTNLDPQWLFNFEVGNNNLFNTGTPLGVIDDFYDSVRSLVTPTVGAVESGCLPLGGSYTIDPLLPISATNYQTFNAAVADLCNCGIAAPVIFTVATAQTFTEQVDICEVVGASAVNTITFNGNGSTLSHAATTSSDRHTLRLSGSDFIRFNNLIFNVGGSIYGHGVHLHNQANNNIFDNCTVQMSTTSTSATLNGFVISTQPEFLGITGPSAGSDSNLFSNNTIIGGDKGIAFYGSSTDRPLNNVATNNTVQDFREYGIRCTNTAGSLLDSNDISRPTRTLFSDFYGIRLGADFSSVVRKNHIHNPFQANGNSTMTFYGLYFAGNVLPGNDNTFVNNLIEDVNSRGAQHGVYLSSSARRVRVQHNTLDLSGTAFPTSGSAITYGINYLGSSGNTFDIRNNNVSITRTGTIAKYGIQVGSAAGSGATISSNNVYINGLGTSNAYGRFNGINYPMLTNWQTANVGAWGQNSTEVDPQYVNPAIDDYNPSNLSMDNTGAPLSVTDDIENTTRSATAPDAGAFEFGCNGLSTIVTNFVSPTDTTISCFGVMDGQVQLSASLGLAPYSYTLLPSTTNNSGSFTGLDTGSYNVVVYDALGCTDTVLFNVTQPTPLLIDSISTIDPSCSIGNDGSILVNATGGTMPYQYNIGGANQSSNTFNNLASGIYLVRVTDANACTDTMSIELTVPNGPSIVSVTDTNVDCNGANNGSILVAATGTNLNYTLNPGAVTNATGYFNNLAPNAYTVVVSDGGSCSVSTTVTITQPQVLSIDSITSLHPSCSLGGDGSMTINISGGTPAYEYNIGGANQSSNLFNNLSSATYVVTVMDTNSCIDTMSINLSAPNAPTITATADTNITCNGLANGSIAMQGVGTSAITYTLNPGAISNATGYFNNLTASTYTVTVSDASNCTVSTTVNITEPTLLEIDSLLITNETCSPGTDGAIVIYADGGTTPYQHNIGGANQASNSFTNLNGGSFTVTVTDANSCSLTSTANISSATSPTIDSVSVTEASCNPGCDATAIINITPGTSAAITYSTNGIAYQGANNYGSLCANNYTAYIQDANGCTDTLAFGITTATTPTINNISLTPTLCIGDSNAAATVLASGGNGVLTYSLNPTSQSNMTGNFIGLYATNYMVSVVDAHGCQVDSNFTILTAPSLVWDVITVTDALCFGDSNGTITVTTSGGIGTILYGVSPIASTNTSGLFSSLAGNVTYTILATDANGCSINTTTFVAEPIAVGDSTVQVTNVTCAGANDGSFSLQGTGGTPAYSYNVMPGNLNNNTGSFTNLSGNTYTVTITDANNCSHTTTITIVEPTSVSIDNTSITDVSCNGLSDGELFVSASGGVGNFNFNLMPGNLINATGIYNGLIANTYTVTATDGNGCTVSTSLTVNEPLPIVIDSLSITNVSCNGLSDGAITVVSSGGNGGNTYLLNPGNVASGSGTFVNLAANIYTMTLTDSLGCSVSIVDSVTEPLPVTASFTTDSVSCFGGSDGQIQMSTAGGTQPYSLTITPGATTNNTGLFTGLIAGSYTVNILDGSGCPLTVDSIMVNQPAQILLTSVNTVDVTCFGDSTGEISVAAAGGTGNITFSLSPNMGTQSPSGNFTGLAAMTYIVTATDAKNCSATTSVTIDQNPKIQLVSFNYTEPICHGDSSGSLSFTAVGGVGTLTYSFDGSPFNTDTAYNNLPAGDYPLSIQDVLGCQVDTNLILTEPDPVGVGSVSITPTTCADSEDGIIEIQAIGGRPFYTYYKRPGISFNRTGRLPKLGVGYYTITIRDSSGCEYDTVFTITSNPNPIQTQITKTDLPCQGYGNEGRARVVVQGGVPPYAYLWSSTPAQNQAEAIGLRFGYYSVEVIDGDGCKVVDTTYINPGNCCIEIFLPNAFSPNGDGRNDEFRVIGTAGIKLRQFEIFNRWGQKVWETYNSTDSWNGIYKGEEQPVADYYYVFRYQCTSDGKEYIKKGNLTLIR